MAAVLVPGPTKWILLRDRDGERTYEVSFLVNLDDPLDGPWLILDCPDLPKPGDVMAIGNVPDTSAYCTWDARVTPAPVADSKSESVINYKVDLIFTTKPIEQGNCHHSITGNPLLDPPKVSGGFNRHKEELTVDRFGLQVTNSAHEPIRGAPVEFDNSTPTVQIEQNVPILQFDLLCQFINCVNEFPLWEQIKRTIKLSQISWSRKYYGTACSVYYTRNLTFEIDPKTWDRHSQDSGSKVLNGEWNEDTGDWDLIDIAGLPPNPDNPTHFNRYQDRQGNPTTVILNGAGIPAAKNRPGNAIVVATNIDTGDFDIIAAESPPVDNTAEADVPERLNSIVILERDLDQAIATHVATFVVTAVTAEGETIASNAISIPIDFIQTEILLQWKASRPDGIGGITGYRIYCQNYPGDEFFLIAILGGVDTVVPGEIFISKYAEVDFLLLGIPTDF